MVTGNWAGAGAAEVAVAGAELEGWAGGWLLPEELQAVSAASALAATIAQTADVAFFTGGLPPVIG
jgi:hypothetical protein